MCRVCAVVSDRVDVRESLHSEFAVEPAPERIEDLVLLLGAVPNVPLMHVSNCRVRSLQSISPRRAWMVGYVRALSSDSFRKDLRYN